MATVQPVQATGKKATQATGIHKVLAILTANEAAVTPLMAVKAVNLLVILAAVSSLVVQPGVVAQPQEQFANVAAIVLHGSSLRPINSIVYVS